MSLLQQMTGFIAQAADPESEWFQLTPTAALKKAVAELVPHSSWSAIPIEGPAPEGMLLNVIVQRFDTMRGVQQQIVRGVRVRYVNTPGGARYPVYSYAATSGYPYAAVEINGWYVTHYCIDLGEFPLPNDVPHTEL